MTELAQINSIEYVGGHAPLATKPTHPAKSEASGLVRYPPSGGNLPTTPLRGECPPLNPRNAPFANKSIIAVVIAALLFCAGGALWAADYVWVGALPYGGDGLTWEDPNNWEDSGSVAANYPGDISTTDTVSISEAILPTGAITLASIEITGGTWTSLSGLTVSGDLTVSLGGDVTVDISVGGDVTISGGTATLAADVTGAVNVTAGSLTLASGVSSLGSVSASGGTLDLGGQTITVGGNWLSSGAALTAAGSSVTVSGASITSGGNSFGNLVIGGTCTAADAIQATGTLTINGDLQMGGYNLTAAAYSNNGTLTLTGAETLSLPQDTSSGLTKFTGAGTALSGLTTFYNLEIEDGTRTVSGTVSGNLTVSGGTNSSVTSAVTGNVTISGGTASVSSTITGNFAISGTGQVTDATVTAASVTVDGSGISASGAVSLTATAGGISGAGTITATNLTATATTGISLSGGAISGTFEANASGGGAAFTNSSGFTAGAVSATGAVSLTATTGNIGVSAAISASGQNVTLAATLGSISGAGTITAVNLTAAGATGVDLSGGAISGTFAATASGGNVAFTNSAAFTAGAISASGDISLDISLTGQTTLGSGSSVGSSGGGTVTFNSDVILNDYAAVTGATVTFAAITGNIKNLVINGDAVFGGAASGLGNVSVTGGATVNAALDGAAIDIDGTAVVAAAITATGAQSYGALTINAGGSLTNTASNIDIDGAVAINGGTLDGTGGTIYVGGNWTYTSGTFTHGGGTVVFDGTSTISDTNNFNNLTVSGTATFPAGLTQAIGGNFDISGGTVLSDSSGNRFKIATSSVTVSATTSITDAEAAAYIGVTPVLGMTASNTKLIFAWSSYTWTGTTSSAWDIDTNWDVGESPVPNTSAAITIPASSANEPTANVAIVCGTLSNAGELTLGAWTLTVSTSLTAFTNTGTLKLNGSGGQVIVAGATPASVGGTVEYTAASTNDVFSGNYNNLKIGSGASLTVAAAVNVGGTLETSGAVTADSLTVTGASTIGANVTTTSGTQTYTGAVTLDAAVNFTGTTVTFSGAVDGKGGSDLTVTGAGVFAAVDDAGALSIIGNATFNGAVTSTASIAVTGTSTVNADITTTAAQTYTGVVTLGANVNFTGTVVTFSGAVDGNSGNDLTVTGAGVFAAVDDAGALVVTGNTTFSGAVTNTTSVAVTGTSIINTTTIETSGTQTYTGAVTLSASGAETFTGSTVTFLDTLTGDTKNVTITGNAVFSGAVTSVANLSVSGTSTINTTTITTSGTQTYTGAVTLGANVTLDAGSSTVTFGAGIAGASHNLDITGSAVFGGTITVVGNLTVSVNAEFNGTVTSTASIAVTGTSTINTTTITTSGTQTYTGAVTLGASGAETFTGSTVTFLDTLTGNTQNVVIAGDAVFGGVASGLGNVSVTGGATVNGALDGAAIDIDGTATVAAVITATGAQAYGALTINLGGSVTNTASGIAVSGDLTTAGTGELNGSGGDVDIDGAVSNGGSFTAGTTTTVGGDWSSSGTFTPGSGTVVFDGTSIISGTNTFNDVTISSGNSATFSAANTFTNLTVDGNGTFGAATTVSGDLVLGASGTVAGNTTPPAKITFTVTGTRTIPNSGNISNIEASVYWNIAPSGTTNHNTKKIFNWSSYTWNGSDNIDWDDDDNWNVGESPVPNTSANITIPSGTTYEPTANVAIVCDTLSNAGELTASAAINCGTLSNTGELILGASTLTVSTLSFTNTGTLKLNGSGGQVTVNSAPPSSVGGTVEYTAAGANDVFSGSYDNLKISSGASLTAAAVTVTVGGTLETGGAVTAASLAVTGTGTSTIGANVTTTTTQTYTGVVTLGAAVNLTGTIITFSGAVDGNGGKNLTVTGAGVFAAVDDAGALVVTGTATFSGAVTNTTSVAVTGTSTVNADITTTAAQTYTGMVTLGANVNFTGTTVTFSGAVDGNGGKNLTVTGAGVFAAVDDAGALSVSGNATFSGAVTNTVSVAVTGTSTINTTTIETSGIQTYTGAVTLGASGTETFTGSTVTFTGALTGNTQNVAVIGNAVFGGAVTNVGDLTVSVDAEFSGAVTNTTSVAVIGTSTINTTTITTSGAQTYTGAATLGANVNFTGTVVTFSGAVDGNSGNNLTVTGTGVFAAIDDTGALSVIGNATFSGDVTSTISVAVTGTSTINADITTTGNQAYSAVTLGANITLTTGNSAVSFGSTIDGGQSLTIAAGTGAVIFSGAVGGNTALSALTVTGAVAVNTITVETTGNQTFNNGVTLGASGAETFRGSTVTFLGALTGNTQDVTITGNAVFSGAVTDVVNLSVSGTSTINTTTITTSGTQTYTLAVTLGANATFTTTSGNITFSSTIGGAQNLTIAAGTGTATFTGMVGLLSTPLTSITITSGSVTANDDVYVNNLTITSGSLTAAATGKTVTVNAGFTITGDYISGSGTTKVGGNWTRTGTFTHGGGTVEFNGTGTSQIIGDNTFSTLTCTTQGKILAFENEKTQTVTTVNINGTAPGGIILQGTVTFDTALLNYWVLNAGGTPGISNCNIKEGRSSAYIGWASSAANSPFNVNSGNTSYFFKDFEWTGAVSTDWATPGNWSGGSAPPDATVGAPTVITIPNKPNQPVLSANVIATTITIGVNSSLDLDDKELEITTVTNNGTLKLQGTSSQVTGTVTPTAGTVYYYGAGTTLGGLTSFFNLEVYDGTHTAGGAITVGGTLSVTSGTMPSHNGILTLAAATTNTVAGTATITGKVDISDAVLTLNQAGAFSTSGEISGSGGTLTVTNNSFTQLTGAVLSGSITINAAGGITATETGNTISGVTLADTNGAISFATSSSTLALGGALTSNPIIVTNRTGGIAVSGAVNSGSNAITLNVLGNVTGSGAISGSTVTIIPAATSKSIGAGYTSGDIQIDAALIQGITASTVNIGDSTNTTYIYSGALTLTDKFNLIYTNNNNNITFYDTAAMGNKNLTVAAGTGSIIQSGGNPAVSATSGGGLVITSAANVGASGTPLLTNIPAAGLSGAGLTGVTSLYLSNSGALTAPAIGNATNTTAVSLATTTSGQLSVAAITTNSGTVTLNSADDIVQTGVITGSALDADALAGITLTSGNSVSSIDLTNTTSGNISYTSAVTGGVFVTNAANTFAGGTITITDNVAIKLNNAGGNVVSSNNGNITFAGPVTLSANASVASNTGAGNISFSSTINGALDLTLNAGSGDIVFTNSVGGTTALGTLTLQAGTAKNSVSGPALSINSNAIVLGALGSSISVDTSASASADKNITFRTDSLTKASGTTSMSINAGSGTTGGDFKIHPITNTHTIKYGDSAMGGTSTIVFYSSSWASIVAKSFTIGDTTHAGAIYVSAVAAGPSVTITNTNTSAINFEGTYAAATGGASLTLNTGTVNINTSATSINLGTDTANSKFEVNAATVVNNDVTITAYAGIKFSGVIDGDAAETKTLTLTTSAASGVGSAVTEITGSVGATKKLGAFTATGGTLKPGGNINTNNGNITIDSKLDLSSAAADYELNTNTGGIKLDKAVTGSGKNLTLNTGTNTGSAAITLNDALGASGSALGVLTVNCDGGIVVGGNFEATAAIVSIAPNNNAANVHINNTGTGLYIPAAMLSKITILNAVNALTIGNATSGAGNFSIGGAGAIDGISSAGLPYNLILQSPAATSATMTFSNNIKLDAKNMTINFGTGNIVNNAAAGIVNITATTLVLNTTGSVGTSAAPLATTIINLGASPTSGVLTNLYISETDALNLSGAVEVENTAGVLSIKADGNVTQAAAISAYTALVETSSGNVTLTDTANVVTNIFLKNTGTSANTNLYTNNLAASTSSLTAAANTSGGSVSITERTGSLTIDTVNSVNGINTGMSAAGGGAVTLDCAAGNITLNKDVLSSGTTSGGAITFNDPVVLGAAVTVSSGAGTGNIDFKSTIDGTADNIEELTLTSGTGTIYFMNNVGSSKYLKKLTLSGVASPDTTIVTNRNGATDGTLLSIKATELAMGTNITIDTSANNTSKDITLKLDKLIMSTGNKINAGSGNIALAPLTPNRTIEYGDTPVITTGANILYQSLWTDFTAASFTVGDADTNKVFISEIGLNPTIFGTNGVPYALIVQNKNSEEIEISGNFKSNGKNLTLQNASSAGSGIVKIVDTRTIDLGAGIFTALKNTGLAGAAGTVNITAKGGINFGRIGGSPIIVNLDSDSAAHNLTMIAGTSDILINGNTGATNPLGNITIKDTTVPDTNAAAANVTFNGTINSSGDLIINHTGTLTLQQSVTADGGFHQNSGITSGFPAGSRVKLGDENTTYITALEITTASSASIDINSDMTIYYHTGLYETAGGHISTKNIFAYYKAGSDDYAWEIIMRITNGTNYITIDGNLGSPQPANPALAGNGPVGNVELTGNTIKSASIWTRADAPTGAVGNVAVNNAGTWTIQPPTGTSVSVNTTGANITQIGGGIVLGANTTMSTGGNISLAGSVTNTTAHTLTFTTLGTVLGTVSVAALGVSGTPLGDVTVNGASTFTMLGAIYSSLLIFNGQTDTILNSGGTGNRLPNVRITHTNQTGVTLSADVLQDDTSPQLDLQQGFLNLGALNWTMGAGVAIAGFNARGGTLTMGNSGTASLITNNNFVIGNGVSISANTNDVKIITKGNFRIEDNVTGNISRLSIEMNESGTSVAHAELYITTTTLSPFFSPTFKNFELKSNPVGANGYVDAMSDLSLSGNWTLPTHNLGDPAILANHIQQFFPGDSANPHIVEFKNTNHTTGVEIRGNTFWYSFVCEDAGTLIKFSNYPDIHTVSDTFKVKGTPGDEIRLNRLVPNPTDPPYLTQPTTPPDWTSISNIWWVISMDGPNVDIQHLIVNFSFALPYPPGMPTNSTISAVWMNMWNVNWSNTGIFLYSFAEDTDGNGRIDRIRVQAAFALDGNFEDFPVVFSHDYEIDTSKAWTNYINSGDLTHPNPAFGRTFYGSEVDSANPTVLYIYIKEKDYPDTGNTPLWWLKDNRTYGSLCMRYDPWYPIGIIENTALTNPFSILSIDTAPPRISYTLSVASQTQVYIRFTEPVDIDTMPRAGDVFETTKNIKIKSVDPLPPIKVLHPYVGPFQGHSYTAQYILQLDGAFSADDLANGITFNEDIFANIRDVPPPKWDWPDPKGGVPLYPRDYDYSSYEMLFSLSDTFPTAIEAKTNISQPNKFRPGSLGVYDATITHRVSDLLIMTKPEYKDDERLTLWPLYVRDLGGIEDVRYGIAQKYDGSETLRNTDLVTEGIFNQALNLALPPRLIFGINIPDDYRSSEDISSNKKLWLPRTDRTPPLHPLQNRIVPKIYDTQRPYIESTKTGNYFWKTQREYLPDHSMFEFVFEFPAPSHSPGYSLFGVRLTEPGIPALWWTKISPFMINIRDIIYQRSGATILNNVINPTKGEQTVLNYILTSGGPVTIHVFTLDGNIVKTLYRGSRSAGEYVAVWDGKNQGGNIVARGLYFIRIVAPDIDEIRKVMVVK